MKLIKTVKCKLKVDKQLALVLRETLNRFADCCNDILAVSKAHNTTNKVKLHRLCYYDMKEKYQLQANHVVCTIARVSNALKGRRLPNSFKPTSMSLDARTLDYIEKKQEVSIATHDGRKHIKLAIGNFQLGLLKGQKPKAATLSYNRSKKVFYINIVLEKEVTVPSGSNPIGVDRGLYNIATTSKGQAFSGKKIMHTRKHYSCLRQQLQSKGTKSAKCTLKRLSGKERRWMQDINHQISKSMVSNCEPGDVIVLEELTHIRDRIRTARKQRQITHSWAFGQLETFIEYKAPEAGIPVVYVDPAYTSQRCSRCGELGFRSKHSFWCSSCNLTNNADFNAAYNIQQASLALLDGLSSTNHEVSCVDAKATSRSNCGGAQMQAPAFMQMILMQI